MVPVFVVEMTAQFVASKGSQIAASIDEKLCLGNIVFLGETMEKRRPQNASRSDGLHESRALVNAAGSVPRPSARRCACSGASGGSTQT